MWSATHLRAIIECAWREAMKEAVAKISPSGNRGVISSARNARHASSVTTSDVP